MLRKVVSVSVLCLLTAMSVLSVWADTIEYTTPTIENSLMTVNGKVNSGETGLKKLNYVLIKRGDSQGIYSAGEIPTNADGTFNFAIDFPTSDEADELVGYTLADGDYILRMASDNCDTVEYEFEFIDTTSAIKALRESTDVDDFNNVMLTMDKRLEFIGFDTLNYNEKLTADEKLEVYTALTGICNIANDDINVILNNFKNQTLYRFLNHGVADTLEKINPSFEETKYTELADGTLKNVLTDNIYSYTKYTSIDDVAKRYEKANIIYLIRTKGAGSFDTLLAQYNTKIGLAAAEYSKYTALSASQKEYVRATVLEAMRQQSNIDYLYFIESFNNAVKNAPGGSGNNSGGGGSSGGGSGGSSRGGNQTTIIGPGDGGNAVVVAPVKQAVFTDIKNHKWAEEAIEALYEQNIISGTGDGKFEPDRYVTREEIVKMLLGVFGVDKDNAELPFGDANKNEWYYGYLSAAYKSGVVTGISDTEFGIGEYVSRQDIAVMIKRAVEAFGKYNLTSIKETAEFDDANRVSAYAAQAVGDLANAGIINGFEDGTFRPLNNCTRAEAAKMLYSLMNN